MYLCPVGSRDSDGDSICDVAENWYGIDRLKSIRGGLLSDAAELFGSEGVDLRSSVPWPLHRLICLCAEALYPGLKAADAAIPQAEAAFANAPSGDPDSRRGIRLHIDVDQQIAIADVDNGLNPVRLSLTLSRARISSSVEANSLSTALFANQYDGGGSSGI